jgi:hypothetical protein
MLKLYFLHTVCHKHDVLRTVLIILEESLDVIKAHIKTIDGLKKAL